MVTNKFTKYDDESVGQNVVSAWYWLVKFIREDGEIVAQDVGFAWLWSDQNVIFDKVAWHTYGKT